MTQLSFLDDSPPIAHARATDPQTSHTAAEKVAVARSWELVADFLRILEVATAEEVCKYAKEIGCGASHERIRGALSPKEMQREGLVEIVDRLGKTSRGNSASRYRLTERGRELVE